jgi:hypothetical protein
MPAIRLAAAAHAALLPALVVAQAQPDHAMGYRWLWLVAALVVVVTMYALLFFRSSRGRGRGPPPTPPARRASGA